LYWIQNIAVNSSTKEILFETQNVVAGTQLEPLDAFFSLAHAAHPACRCWVTAGYVHPNLNLTDPEDEVDLDILVGNHQLKLDINVALSNSFGFGGHNSCVMFKKYQKAA
jgi:hypothetical protein